MRIELPNLAAVPCRQRPKRARERERERPQQLQQQIQQFARIDWLRGTVDSLPRGESVLPFRFRYHPHTISCHFGLRSILASGPLARL